MHTKLLSLRAEESCQVAIPVFLDAVTCLEDMSTFL